jgi:hypothetical protein
MTAQQARSSAAAVQRSGPLNAIQGQLWALHQMSVPAPAVNLAYALRVDGPLDHAALGRALRDSVRLNEPLRTRYPRRGGAAVAEVTEEQQAAQSFDLTPVNVATPAEAIELVRAERTQPFDLEQELPLRCSLLRQAAHRHILLVTLHHIAADGWSADLLARQLTRSYAGHLRGRTELPAKPGRECTDLAREQAGWLAGSEAEVEAEWWTRRLADAEPQPLAALTTGDPVARGACESLARHVIAVPDELTAGLRAFGREAAVSLFAVLFAAFGATLTLWTGCRRPVIGSLVAGRTSAASGMVLGAHYNVLLLDTDFGGDPSLAECAVRAGATAVGVLDHQELPYRVLAERWQRERRWDAARMPQAMFLLDRYPVENLRLDGCQTTGLYLDEGAGRTPIDGGGPTAEIPAATSADLCLSGRESGQRLTISAFYRPSVLTGTAALGVLSDYLDILARLCDEPHTALSEVAVAGRTLSGRSGPRQRTGRPGLPALHDIVQVSPAEAISPVGWWTGGPDRHRSGSGTRGEYP